MPIQTTYGYNRLPLQPGMIAAMTHEESITAYATVAIPFGIGLLYTGDVNIVGDPGGTVNNLTNYRDRLRVQLPASGNARFAGVAGFDHLRQLTGDIAAIETINSAQDVQYNPGSPIKVIKKGRVVVFVDAAESPAIGDPVFLRFTANGAGTSIGYFRTTADTSRALDVSGSARWASPAIPQPGGAFKFGILDLDII